MTSSWTNQQVLLLFRFRASLLSSSGFDLLNRIFLLQTFRIRANCIHIDSLLNIFAFLILASDNQLILLHDLLGNIIISVDLEPLTLEQVVTLSSLQVPEFVEQSIITLFLKRFYDGVEVCFRLDSFELLALIKHFNVNDFFPRLNGSSQL
mgnify:CR=1 FL=1